LKERRVWGELPARREEGNITRCFSALLKDLRLVKGTSMAKISIVSRRRRNTRFPETEAQRRARVRESGAASEFQTLQMEGLEVLSGTLSLGLPELTVDDWAETTILAEMGGIEEAANRLKDASPATSDMTMQVVLDPEQSRSLRALSFLAGAHEQGAPSPTFELTEWRDQHRVVLQFSLHAETVPAMISLKELCQQLKVGRRSVLRLIRERRLRCYRIGRRYRFATSDVKQYLKQISSQ
jgi:excisionase family DNA binding protein